MKNTAFVLLLVLLSASALYSPRQQGEKRLALVIGNANYSNPKEQLYNTLNDAEDMKKVLGSLGFHVMECLDCKYAEMADVIRLFNKALLNDGYEASLFYYSGHGVRIGDKNYIVPTNSEIKSLTEVTVDFQCIDVQNDLLNPMKARSKMTNIMILDACLSNPLNPSTEEGVSKGLSPKEVKKWALQIPPQGTFAAYATEPEHRAKDGNGRNGVYTSQLLKYISVPDLRLEDIFKYTRTAVIKESNGKQIPWEFNMTQGDFYFKKANNDFDKDGIPNEFDNCPNQAGLKAHGGCPKPILKDSDGDGVPNKYDKCPDEVGTLEYDGCFPPVKTNVDNGTTTKDLPGTLTETVNGVSFNLKLIKAGSFRMGSPANEVDRLSRETQHQVILSKDYWLGEHEVTQELYQAVMGTNPSHFSTCPKCPVETVSWKDAQTFIKKLNKRTDGGYRLPTEAEWEYAARAGTTTPFHTGNNLTTDQANYDGNYPYNGNAKGKYRKKTTSVGSFSPNNWGVYDMSGNVYEWCQDWYGDYLKGAVTDPTGAASGSYRVFRGGSWYIYAEACRVANRNYDSPGYRYIYIGFRLSKTVTP